MDDVCFFLPCILKWVKKFKNGNDCHSSNMVLKQQDIILGYNIHLGFSSLINQAINIVILYGKYYIFKCKLENESPLCFIFKIKLKDYLRICNYDNRIMTLINRAFVWAEYISWTWHVPLYLYQMWCDVYCNFNVLCKISSSCINDMWYM